MKNYSDSKKCFPTNGAIVNNNFENRTSDSNTIDTQRLIELISTTDDVELLVKFFNVLAVYLVSNDNNKGDIVTNNIIYDKIRTVLSCGQSQKTVRILNFITALLYLNEEEDGPSRAKSLVLYAQNMIRISGCLLLICNMFTSCMLHQETWKGLCQCLAESCRNSTENQSYCSHLVPMAVQKCMRGNTEAMEILKSLVHNHKYNAQLFVDSNGITIFSRQEILMNDTSMQLLSSLIQNCAPEILAMIHQNVFQNINHLKCLYGTQNRIGQWATIIWHQLKSHIKVTKGVKDKKHLKKDDGKEIIDNESSAIDIRFLKPNDTERLLQNVIREIHHYNAKNNATQKMNTKQDNYNIFNNQLLKTRSSQIKEFDKAHRNISIKLLDSNMNEMSFSFLLKASQGNIGLAKNNKACRSQLNGNTTATETSICFQMESKLGDTNKHFSRQDSTVLNCSLEFENINSNDLEFNPITASTPKKSQVNKSTFLQTSPSRYRQNTLYKVNKAADKSIKNSRHSKDLFKMKQRRRDLKNKSITTVQHRTDLKNRSMTSRLFHAINDSCTTFVKTVKNIFKSKKQDDVHQSVSLADVTRNNTTEQSCSYSFTDYMRKRDALLANDTRESKIDFTEINIKSCKTCNDTVSLKHKVNHDHYLKKTVTKLKLGINMYGCDFKKISKAMWPRETYMTPEVLYNLYRKLIVK